MITVPSCAKLNLSLKVLGKRADGFHELRTVFQTVSLADRLSIDFAPGRAREVEIESSAEIPDNLVVRAARALMDATKIRGRVRFRLEKRIPMGAGLGGGSSNAAAVLLALPALARKPVPLAELHSIAAALGSDVPFFLYGGTALGLGRGDEVYPLPDARGGRHVLLVAPNIHVATPPAFVALNRPPLIELTPIGLANRMKEFPLMAWSLACAKPGVGWERFCENDFEAAVFPQFPLLKSIHRELRLSGAHPARMSGSGSALFGVFSSREQGKRAIDALRNQLSKVSLQWIRFSTRAQYRAQWSRALGVYATEGTAWARK